MNSDNNEKEEENQQLLLNSDNKSKIQIDEGKEELNENSENSGNEKQVKGEEEQELKEKDDENEDQNNKLKSIEETSSIPKQASIEVGQEEEDDNDKQQNENDKAPLAQNIDENKVQIKPVKFIKKIEKKQPKITKKDFAQLVKDQEQNITFPEDKLQLLSNLIVKEIDITAENKKNEEENRKKAIEERLNSDRNKQRHKEWLRYYELKGQQYNYHLPEDDSILCWDKLNTHRKFLYCMNIFPLLGSRLVTKFESWTHYPYQESYLEYFKFDIIVRFWFLCQTYTLRQHVGKDEKGKFKNGIAYMYARKLLFNNLTIGFSYWNYYYQSGNYVADLWQGFSSFIFQRSDVHNYSFCLFRKGKRSFGFDEYVRDHKDLMKEAQEDVEFIDEFGRELYDEIYKDTLKDYTITYQKEIKKEQEKLSEEDKVNKWYKIKEEVQEFETKSKTYQTTDFQKIFANKKKLRVRQNKAKILPMKENLNEQEQLKEQTKKQAQLKYYNMIIQRKKRYHWKHFWSDLVVEQLGQFEFWYDWESPLTHISAYLVSYSMPNYHQEFLAQYNDGMSKNIKDNLMNQMTRFRKTNQVREYCWPYRPKFQIPYVDIIKEYDSICKFNMHSHIEGQFLIVFLLALLGTKILYYNFGRIAFDRYLMQVRHPWTMLTAFAQGLAAIRHFVILHGPFG